MTARTTQYSGTSTGLWCCLPATILRVGGIEALCISSAHTGVSSITGALEQYDAVLRLDPQHWIARNNRAVVTMYSCRLAPALRDVEAALAEAPWAFLQVLGCVRSM